eukprot:1335511-Pleurochrysis_carterae.AAC.1
MVARETRRLWSQERREDETIKRKRERVFRMRAVASRTWSRRGREGRGRAEARQKQPATDAVITTTVIIAYRCVATKKARMQPVVCKRNVMMPKDETTHWF